LGAATLALLPAAVTQPLPQPVSAPDLAARIAAVAAPVAPAPEQAISR
ncbi:MAG: hypothetical protein IT452_12685, partial [Planctomycetia bacterium]|nr:hypothetical protein [Planctomycetia bacterium]